MKRPTLAIAAVVALLAAMPASAAAQPPAAPAEGADARAIAQRGRAAYDAGDYTTGCPLLGEAYRLDDTLLGVGFAFADCRERDGRLVEAHDLFVGVARKALARGEARAAEAQQRADGIAARIATIVLDVPGAGDGARVTLDGVELARESWATPRLVDPGAHVVILEDRGGRVVRELAELPVGRTTKVDLVVNVAATPAPAASAEPAAEPSTFPWKTVGLVGAGTGVAVLGTGIVVGLVAKGSYDDAESGCDSVNACTPDAAATRTDARSLAHVGTALFVGGAVLGAAGAALFIFGPESSPTATAVVGPGHLQLRGDF